MSVIYHNVILEVKDIMHTIKGDKLPLYHDNDFTKWIGHVDKIRIETRNGLRALYGSITIDTGDYWYFSKEHLAKHREAVKVLDILRSSVMWPGIIISTETETGFSEIIGVGLSRTANEDINVKPLKWLYENY